MPRRCRAEIGSASPFLFPWGQILEQIRDNKIVFQKPFLKNEPALLFCSNDDLGVFQIIIAVAGRFTNNAGSTHSDNNHIFFGHPCYWNDHRIIAEMRIVPGLFD